jgi:crotonobetainyl-CoA:carnitine CoA-transferase CaiB-like acyl-CoA transferase
MSQSRTKPLDGIRVVDLSRIVAGPYCTQQMADLGAEVIKVEPPNGDDTRRFGPPFLGDDATYYFSINRGKRSIALNLKERAGQQVIYDLVQTADVVVENFRPGVAKRLGIDAQTLQAIKPDIIYVSISGYGAAGHESWTQLPGYDLIIQGAGGIPSLTGPVDGPPFKIAGSWADIIASLNAFGGVMAALLHREKTGEGATLDISMFDGQLASLMYHATSWLNTRKAPARHGNAHASICPYETFETADGYLNIACGNDSQFKNLSLALGLSELAEDERFGENAMRVKHRDALLARLIPVLQNEGVTHWVQVLSDAGVPCGPVASVPEALGHPQALAREMVVETNHPVYGPIKLVNNATGFSGAQDVCAPPLFSEHSREVLMDILEYDNDRIDDLIRSGVVIEGKNVEP